MAAFFIKRENSGTRIGGAIRMQTSIPAPGRYSYRETKTDTPSPSRDPTVAAKVTRPHCSVSEKGAGVPSPFYKKGNDVGRR